MTTARLLAAGLFLGLLGLSFFMSGAKTTAETFSFENTRNLRANPKEVKVPGARVEVSERREEFQKFLTDGYRSLGRDEELLTATDVEKEHYSPGLLRSSEWLGAVADRLEKAPEFAHDALYFYAKCSEDESLLVPVRAVCYRNVFDVANKNSISLKELAFNADAVARDVKELAAKIP